MLTYRAKLRSLNAHHQVAAVTAFPQSNTALFEDRLGLHVVQKLAITLFVSLLDGSNAAELLSQLMEAFLIGFTSHAVIHVSPLVVFALGCMQQVLSSIAQLTQCLEPQLGVFLFVLGSLQEQGSDLLEACLLGNGGKVGVLVAGLGLTGEGLPQILLSLGTGKRILCGSSFLDLYKLVSALLTDGALEIRSHRTFMNIAANSTFPFFHFLFLRFFIKL